MSIRTKIAAVVCALGIAVGVAGCATGDSGGAGCANGSKQSDQQANLVVIKRGAPRPEPGGARRGDVCVTGQKFR